MHIAQLAIGLVPLSLSSLSLCLCPALGFNCANLVAKICGEMLKCFAFGCSDWRENEFIAYGDSEREREPFPGLIQLSCRKIGPGYVLPILLAAFALQFK